MLSNRLHATLSSAFLASLLLAGCANLGADQADDPPTLAEFDANMNQGVVLARLLGLDGSKKDKQPADPQQQKIAELERQLQQERQGKAQHGSQQTAPAQLASKLGVVFAAEVDQDLGQALQQALLATQAEHPVVVIAADEMANELASYRCQANRIEQCAGQLASYPGVQQVVVISQLATSTERAQASFQLHHTGYGMSQPVATLESPSANDQLTQQAARSLANGIISDALASARLAPWSTRAFKQEGNEIFLAAGARSGLKPGMKLAVHNPGRTITSPTGGIAGWIPGSQKGLVKVTGLFGTDYAIAELLEGQPPAPTDPLLIAAE